jgi:hypothetical protein
MANHSLSPRNKFAKRHYEAIATAMQNVCPPKILGRNAPDDDAVQWAVTVTELADLFARDNGMFKRDRFYQACQVGANVRARS